MTYEAGMISTRRASRITNVVMGSAKKSQQEMATGTPHERQHLGAHRNGVLGGKFEKLRQEFALPIRRAGVGHRARKRVWANPLDVLGTGLG